MVYKGAQRLLDVNVRLLVYGNKWELVLDFAGYFFSPF